MMDNFHEEVIVRKRGAAFNNFLYILAWFMCIVSALIASTCLAAITSLSITYLIPMLAFGGIAFYCYWVKDTFKVEYEYTLTNGFVEIGKVINNKRRKDLFSFKMKDVEILASVDNEDIKQYESDRNAKKIRAILNNNVPHYFACINVNDQRTLLYFEPSRELLDLMKIYNNRTVIL